jgi:hypothetical protein
MKLATTIRTSFATAILCAWAGAVMAQAVAEPVGNFAGWYVHDHVTNTTTLQTNAPQAVPVVVYDNTASTASFAVSSTDLASTWGDELLTTNVGTLSATVFSLFNSGSSAGVLLTAQIRVDFFDAITAAPLGAFTTNVNFGTGLPQGFYSLITVTGLDPLAINLNTSDVVVTQKVLSKTGAANRLGIVSFNPVTVGSSDPDMYIASATIGPAGWYTFGNGPANPGWQVSVVTAPVPTEKSSWGAVKNLYR